METVLLTGATGFLGSHLAETLVESGYRVRALVRRETIPILAGLPNLELVLGDLNSPQTLIKAVEQVDYVIHCAGAVKVHRTEDFYRINTQGTQHLLQALLNATTPIKRFVYVSSLAAAGPNIGKCLKIDLDQANPVSHYGHSKLEAERIIQQQYVQKLPITIVRPPAIYGPRDRECLAFFKMVQWHVWPSLLSKNKQISLIYVQDAANAILKAMQNDQGSGHTYFIDDGHTYLIHDLIDVLKDLLGVKRIFDIQVPSRLLKWVLMVAEAHAKLFKKPTMMGRDKLNELIQQDWTCNSQLANQRLGWHAETNWSAGALKTLTWYQQEGWIKRERYGSR